MYKKAIVFALLLAFATPVFAQTSATQPPKPDPAELRKEAIAFLRETMGDVQNMRTLENRISFSAELAGLMWFHDEQEARTMFNAAISDFRELIARLDGQMMALPEEEEGGSVGRFPFGDASDRGRVEMKYRVAMAVRQQVATSIAEHDPDVALGFFYDTASTNPKAASLSGRDTYFEMNLLKEVALKSPAKASQYGLRSLEKGLDSQHVDLLRKIYDKDPEVAVEFGQALLKKAKDTKFKSYEVYTLGSLIEFGSEKLEASRKPEGKKAVYSQADMRELTEVMAKHILDGEGNDFGMQYISAIEKYSPARAAQVRAKLRAGLLSQGNANAFTVRGNRAVNVSAPPPDYSGPVNTAGYGTASANSNSNSRSQQEQEAKRLAEEKLMTDVAKIGKGELPKEEREKVVAQSRKILMQTRGKDKQIMGLSMLASQVAKAGDKQLAAEIMRDAESLVNPQPKNYQDFMYTWMLASGYAEADPDKAFPILESAIGRANDLISAFVKVGEFIDVTEEMISDGEAQVGAFGGGMIRGLSRELGVAETTLVTLVRADFGKTRALTNRFDRPEVRILAKMLVLRSILGKNAGPESPEAQVKKVLGQN
ncbi:MAG: hypothetical protein ABL984_12220 [Pyrinomonadaceae bacterium]